MIEIWKDIKGYEGLYQISNLGRVKSLKRIVFKCNITKKLKSKILSESVNRLGYPAVILSKKAMHVNKKIHRLVAIAFIPNPENKPCINHINGIKTDYRIENLEWCTHKENSQHAFRTGLNKMPSGKDHFMYNKIGNLHHNYGKTFNNKPILQYSKDMNFIKEYSSLKEASILTGINKSNISTVCNNYRVSAGGYKWKFKN
ncbi:HNH endonuclease [Rhodobacteraceae phage LS06-2018-MD05]|nr:HNH endonuclease [Rhodobacteraceae phage LS06-2018-MD05]